MAKDNRKTVIASALGTIMAFIANL